MRTPLLTLAAAAACIAGVPAAAHATTMTLEGGTYVVRATEGPDIFSIASDDDGRLLIREEITGPLPAGCATDGTWDAYPHCETAGRALRVEAGGGDDTIPIDLGAPAIPITVLGGAGADKLTGHDGPSTLDGGPGDDTVLGGWGADVVLGGDGSDTLSGDGVGGAAADVIDGGPGLDTAELDWLDDVAGPNRPIAVSLNGAADDGRPGEGDNVTSLERIRFSAAATLVAGAEAVDFEIPSNAGTPPVKLVGSPQADRLKAAHGHDELDGGAGDDTIEGGYGDDTITGGPGRDTINADASAGCDFVVCNAAIGNDTIHARDGEADRIDCGVGNDVAYVDERDTVSNCEQVQTGRPAGGGGGPQGPVGGPQGGGKPGTTSCKVPKIKRGLTLGSARSRLKRAGCRTKTVKQRSRAVEKGRVIRISAKAGRKTGKKITIYVSKGAR